MSLGSRVLSASAAQVWGSGLRNDRFSLARVNDFRSLLSRTIALGREVGKLRGSCVGLQGLLFE